MLDAATKAYYDLQHKLLKERYEKDELAQLIGATILSQSSKMTVNQLIGKSGCIDIANKLREHNVVSNKGK